MAGVESDNNKALWEGWVSPSVAIDSIRRRDLLFETAVRTIGERIKAGLVRVIAQTVVGAASDDRRSYAEIGERIWGHWDPLENYDFWRTGDLQIYRAGVTGYGDQTVLASLFGVRFEPAGIAALLPAGSVVATARDEPASARSKALPRTPLSKTEAERFCRAIIAGWPDATQDWAHAKALLFYPENDVPRDWFRSILRSMRPEKRPGRLPNERD
jgi:hypothetical protein